MEDYSIAVGKQQDTTRLADPLVEAVQLESRCSNQLLTAIPSISNIQTLTDSLAVDFSEAVAAAQKLVRKTQSSRPSTYMESRPSTRTRKRLHPRS